MCNPDWMILHRTKLKVDVGITLWIISLCLERIFSFDIPSIRYNTMRTKLIGHMKMWTTHTTEKYSSTTNLRCDIFIFVYCCSNIPDWEQMPTNKRFGAVCILEKVLASAPMKPRQRSISHAKRGTLLYMCICILCTRVLLFFCCSICCCCCCCWARSWCGTPLLVWIVEQPLACTQGVHEHFIVYM